VHYFGRTLSWQEIDSMSSGFAATLVDRGYRGHRIALYMQNMPQFVIAVLGAWKAGAVVVPVNPMLKAAELDHILRDAASTVLVAMDLLLTRDIVKVARDSGVTLVLQTGADDLAGSHPLADWLPTDTAPAEHEGFLTVCAEHTSPPVLVDISSSSPAFITYTSGTTGRPKGAINSHAAVAFNSAAMTKWLCLGSDDVVLGMAPLFHITGLIGHVTIPVVSGAALVLGFRFDAGVVLRLIEEYRPTFTVGAITALVALLDHPERAARDLSSLKKVFSGGAPVSPSLVARFEAELGPYIHNVYGLTEATSATHCVPFGVRAPVDPVTGALSIGVPCPNTEVHVVGDDGLDVPIGEPGELVIRGPQIASGYLGNPEATADAFIPAGFRTGDIGAMDADGWFYLIDRSKDMIIASGYKVWPREVEDVLYQHPAVREAAVVGVPDPYRGENVKAFVSLVGGASADPAELVEFCRQRMAVYKSPKIVEILSELPKTTSGKILRRTLRDLERS
jgi:long-chain acyl-CoA synthetase